MLVGAAKSGTTSLYFYLRQHPSIFMPEEIKEPGFFCFAGKEKPPHPADNPYPYLWRWVVTGQREYSDLFAPARSDQKLGEATPEYLHLYEDTIRNITRLYGARAKDLKLAAVLRNPIDRIWSHYWMARRDGYESLPFAQATDPKTIAERLSKGWHPSYDYLGFGFYTPAISAYLREFGKSNVKVFLFEELADGPERVCAELFDFIGVDRAFAPDVSVVYNPSGQIAHPTVQEWLFWREHALKSLARMVVPYELLQRIKYRIIAWNSRKAIMPEETRERLQQMYRASIEDLARLIGRDLSTWLR